MHIRYVVDVYVDYINDIAETLIRSKINLSPMCSFRTFNKQKLDGVQGKVLARNLPPGAKPCTILTPASN